MTNLSVRVAELTSCVLQQSYPNATRTLVDLSTDQFKKPLDSGVEKVLEPLPQLARGVICSRNKRGSPAATAIALLIFTA